MKNNDNIMKALDFVLPTRIIFGPGTIKQIGDEFKKSGKKKPLIVTGSRGVAKSGILKKVTDLLDASGVGYVHFDGVEPNPKDSNVNDGAKIAIENGCDSLIAIGGGSPIDAAKAIGVLMAHNSTDIKKYEGKTAATEANPYFVAVPTTAGSASEVTFSSVITDSKDHYKMTVKSATTAPTLAIADPELTVTMPKSITAATGVDALTHAIEGFTALPAGPIGDACALYAIELIYNNLVNAYNEPANIEARSGMLMGSMLAGISFSHSDVAAVHCVAESLGGMYDLPHGECNAIFLPYIMEYNMSYCVSKYARVASAMGCVFSSEEEGAKMAVENVKKLCKDVEIRRFADLVPDKKDFETLAVNSEQNGSNADNPRPMTKEDYMHILNLVYDAK